VFNHELKFKYLETKKSEPSKNQYQLFYNKTEAYERGLGKDLMDFSLEEILNMIDDIQPKNDSQEKVYRAFVSGYINWAIDQGLRSNKVNPLYSKQ
jgi:hypothetical protein